MSIQVITSDPLIIKDALIKPLYNKVIVYIDNWDFMLDKSSIPKVFVHIEPEAIAPVGEFLSKNHRSVDYILTFDSYILRNCPNSRKYIYGNTWILKKDWICIYPEDKLYKISSILSSKDRTIAHKFRNILYMNKDKIYNIPFDMYKGISIQGNLLDTDKLHLLTSDRDSKIMALRDYQFHIAIENSRDINYFTEKLCDCLITKTIPIYYGAPNIGDYFDITGWIILESLSMEDIQNKLLILTPEYYMKYILIINANFEKVKEYMHLTENINRTLKSLPYF